MGCDIHPAVEVQRKGVWRYSRPTTLCRWYAETWTDTVKIADYNKRRAEHIAKGPSAAKYWKPAVLGERINLWDRCKYRLPEFFYDRNYRVFAVVGNVRNGSGFAGVYTHDEIPFIQDSRGIPDDISPEAEAKLSNEHSAGWVTLTELKAYNYRQTITEGGIVDESTFMGVVAGEAPSQWSGGISGPDIVVLTPEQYAGLYESPIDLLQGKSSRRKAAYDDTKRYHVRATWQRQLYDQVSDIPNGWIPYLENLVPKGGTDDDVRVVFDFDS